MNEKSSRSSLMNVKSRLVHKLLNKVFLFFVFMTIIALVFIIAVDRKIIEVPVIVTNTLGSLLIIFVSYALATLFTKLTVNSILNYFEGMGQIEERILMGKMYLAFVYLLATLVTFWQLGITIQNIAIFLGLITTGFAFAIRDVILSYFIWFILLTKKPFKIGDYIKVGEDEDMEGLVKHIGLFYVVVDPTPDTYEDYFKIPNKIFLEKPIKNYGRGKFRNQFDMYFDMEELPANLPSKVEALKEKVWNTLDVNVSFFLGSDSDGVKITVYYKSTYERREQVRHQITSMMLNELKPIDGQ
ncbi:mechanosensitive ion channel domain-containing protein [uncultured Methanolobus sp.]|uniref:mechanosensitive ion channel family protein n=1 Tax=uncultured Methanolobus sp. TaxID=218300 RepID=UPI0029C73E17|nr:mechanosensitive ion channel domain-containing protein [uncultured Methanolobus sp.]